jgi:deoxyribodipyrimidine photolyase-related protein
MKQANILFPNQLFEESPLFENKGPWYLVEEFLFFKQYPFHKQKLAFHRASMKRYADFLRNDKNVEVQYIESANEISDIRFLVPYLKKQGVQSVNYIDPVDNWLQKRLDKGFLDSGIQAKQYASPMFLNSKEDLLVFF